MEIGRPGPWRIVSQARRCVVPVGALSALQRLAKEAARSEQGSGDRGASERWVGPFSVRGRLHPGGELALNEQPDCYRPLA